MSKRSAKRPPPRRQASGGWKGWALPLLLIVVGLVTIKLLTRERGGTRAIRHETPAPEARPSTLTSHADAATSSHRSASGAAPTAAELERSVYFGKVTLRWDDPTPWLRQTSFDTGDYSNVRPVDYVGPETCGRCHADIFKLWSSHSHSRMNAVANEQTVVGDFSGQARIQYLGGVATFYREGNAYRMRLRRDNVERIYDIKQTIGSRFYQYYIGTLVAGPEPPEDRAYHVNHVLPFGYWIDRREWVPVVHVHFAGVGGRERDEEILPDGKRIDPFRETDLAFAPYAEGCSSCHTTWAIGDMLIRNLRTLGKHAPRAVDLCVTGYLREAHPELVPERPFDIPSFENMMQTIRQWEAVEHAVSLGISCEACHLGGARHARKESEPPRFFPASPHVFTQKHENESRLEFGRVHDNLNWACGRCHAGTRHEFAAGMGVWNSIEYTDAMKGSCYSRLTCVHCHNPHQTIGAKWSRSEDDDDASCLQCHESLRPLASRQAHTHHPAGTTGARCLNCHMPRLNEGLQDVVRTHMIFSPTRREMIEANQPNACNLCHVEKPIDWTLTHLEQWYGARFNEQAIAAMYPNRKGPAALGWLHHPDKSVRLVAADALTRQQARWALRPLLGALDDPYLLNRQFAQIGLEKMLGINLRDYGYHHYMMPSERVEPLARIRAALLPASK